MSDRSNENPILDPGGSIAEQLATKDAEILRLKENEAELIEEVGIAEARTDKAERERDELLDKFEDFIKAQRSVRRGR